MSSPFVLSLAVLATTQVYAHENHNVTEIDMSVPIDLVMYSHVRQFFVVCSYHLHVWTGR